MGLPISRLYNPVPRRLPIGAKYVVEGFGSEDGNLRVIARYVVFPDGNRINVPSDPYRPASPRALAVRRGSSSKRSRKGRFKSIGEKLAARPGTG
jgi:hypothetical protein